jgi:hypothetical protein
MLLAASDSGNPEPAGRGVARGINHARQPSMLQTKDASQRPAPEASKGTSDTRTTHASAASPTSQAPTTVPKSSTKTATPTFAIGDKVELQSSKT